MASYEPLPRQDYLQGDAGRAQANALAEPYAALAKPGEWSTGFFDCCGSPGGTGLCCMAVFCPCIQYGRIVEQLSQVSTIGQAVSRDSDGVVCGGSFWGGCLTFTALAFLGNVTLGVGTGLGHSGAIILPCQVPLHLQLRTHMRSKYGLQGDAATDLLLDILAVWCCSPCAMCQEARELAIRQAAERAGAGQPGGGVAAAPHQAVIYPPMVTAPPPDPRIYMPPPDVGVAAAPPPPPAYGTPVMAAAPPVPPPATGVPVSAPPGKCD